MTDETNSAEKQPNGDGMHVAMGEPIMKPQRLVPGHSAFTRACVVLGIVGLDSLVACGGKMTLMLPSGSFTLCTMLASVPTW